MAQSRKCKNLSFHHRRRRGGARVRLWSLAGLGVTATYIGQGLLVAQVLTLIFERSPFTAALRPVLAIIALLLVRAWLLWLHQRLASQTAAAIKHLLRGQLYTHLLNLGPGYLERTRTGRVQATLVDGVERLERYIGFYLPQIFIVLIAPTLIILALLTVDWVASGVILVSIFLVLVGPKLFEGALGKEGNAHWDAYRELNAQFLDRWLASAPSA